MSRLILAVSLLVVLVAFAMINSGKLGRVSTVEAVPIVGAGSCLDPSNCTGLGPNAVIGENSCNGLSACINLQGVVGDNSCSGTQSCVSLTGFVGDSSCTDTQACVSASGLIGDGSCTDTQSCVSLSGAIGDGLCTAGQACVSFSGCLDLPVCNVEVAKSVEPSEIPETGETPVTYTVRIDFVEDERVNFIEDDQHILNVATECELFDGDGTAQGAPTMPGDFFIDQYIICEYTYEPPAGNAGDTHDNIVTVNVGHPDCPEEEGPIEPTGLTGAVGPADHNCDVQAAAIFPGEEPGTYDVTAEASVLYLEAEEPTPTPSPTPDNRRDLSRPQPPNIGAGLSGLFNGMPTPLPTAPSAVAPTATSPVIRPPSTGNAGLVR